MVMRSRKLSDFLGLSAMGGGKRIAAGI